jgi:hypothetical protein
MGNAIRVQDLFVAGFVQKVGYVLFLFYLCTENRQ